MPNETFYFKEKHEEILDALVEENEQFDNRSQAVQYCINQQMQRDIINEGHDNE